MGCRIFHLHPFLIPSLLPIGESCPVFRWILLRYHLQPEHAHLSPALLQVSLAGARATFQNPSHTCCAPAHGPVTLLLLQDRNPQSLLWPEACPWSPFLTRCTLFPPILHPDRHSRLLSSSWLPRTGSCLGILAPACASA